MRYPLRIILPLFMLLPSAAIHAQVVLDSGARVRITSPELPNGKTVGPLERFSADTIVVAGRVISRTSIRRFEVSQGRRSKWRAGMGYGVLIGAGFGVLSGAIGCPDDTEIDNLPALCAAAFGGIGGAAGLLVGGLVGSSLHEERWRLVSPNTIRVAPIIRLDGTLGISIGWAF